MGVCKKLDLNILKIDWAIAILSSKNFVLNFSSTFWEIFLAEENCDNSGNFKGTLKIFFSKWSLINYQLLYNGSMSPKAVQISRK